MIGPGGQVIESAARSCVPTQGRAFFLTFVNCVVNIPLQL